MMCMLLLRCDLFWNGKLIGVGAFVDSLFKVSSQMELWSQELAASQSAVGNSPSGISADIIGDVGRAESLLQHHNESLNHVQNAVFSVLQRGQELLHLMESASASAKLLQGSESRVQNLLETLHQSQMDLDDVAELRRVSLELDVQIVHLQVESNQVTGQLKHIHWPRRLG